MFAVVFYTDYRKENEWYIYKVYRTKEEALTWVSLHARALEPDLESWVGPHSEQKVIWEGHAGKVPDPTQDYENGEGCFVQSPGETNEDYHKRCEPLYKEQLLAFNTQESPWQGMSWTPNVAVVELEVE